MAFDEGLAERVREGLSRRSDLSERKMFGGLCFMLGGNMCCGVVGEELMLRVGPDAYESTLALEHAREMDFTGRSLRGMVYVATDGLSEDSQLDEWLRLAVDFAASLPAK
ncbi:MAG: TfoX/Sxy family protein [Gemmatimonadetes bacterium]|nr:TfoX/Sxy family protein [Gemmatimonadota bacterium]MDA1103839.1 TfoX/Sxy family protein [Gemmatimonadota bacterium]